MSTKIHAATEALGLPVRLIATPGQRNDIAFAHDLVDGMQAQAALADKGYDTDRLVNNLAETGAIHVSQLFRWRKEFCRIEEPATSTAPVLAPGRISKTVSAPPAELTPASRRRRQSNAVTIELGNGRRVRVDSDIDTEALGRILDVVLGRR